MREFLSLGISQTLANVLEEQGIKTPTPIQEQSIPVILDGKDIIAQAQTGTGKTFAFILPILEKLDFHASHIQALIITPTRELAIQITEEIKKFTSSIEELNVLAVYGGQDVEKQLKKLKKNIHIVVGTPGRLGDHIRRKTVDFSAISHLVLDEADQMLHIGFLHEVEDIIRETPKGRQTLLFSATMPNEVKQLAQKHMKLPESIQVEKTQGPAANVEQLAIQTTPRAKQATLIQLIEADQPFLGVIFCRTKRRVTKLFEALRAYGFKVDELHGDLSQTKREQVMKRFRDAEIQLLVATDVASRGLDVEGVTHVYNYDIPQDAESFVHRIGRTGRAGMTGKAITFYSTDDRPMLDQIEQELGIRIEKQNLGNTIKKEDREKLPSAQKLNRSPKPSKKKQNSSKRYRAKDSKETRADTSKPKRSNKDSKGKNYSKSATKPRRGR